MARRRFHPMVVYEGGSGNSVPISGNQDRVWWPIVELLLYFLFSLYMPTTWRPHMANYQYTISFNNCRISASLTQISFSLRLIIMEWIVVDSPYCKSPQPNLTPVFLNYSFFMATFQTQDQYVSILVEFAQKPLDLINEGFNVIPVIFVIMLSACKWGPIFMKH